MPASSISQITGQPAIVRNLNAELVAQTLRAQAQQRPLVVKTAQAYVALQDGTLVRREEWTGEYDQH